MIKKFEEFVEEGFMKTVSQIANDELIRDEDGIRIEIDGKSKVILWKENPNFKNIGYIGDSKYIKDDLNSGDERYIFCSNDNDSYTYFCISEDDVLKNNSLILNPFLYSDYDLSKDNFKFIRAYCQTFDEIDIFNNQTDIDYKNYETYGYVSVSTSSSEYFIFDDDDNVEEYAKNDVIGIIKSDLNRSGDMYVTSAQNYINYCGTSWLDEDYMRDAVKDNNVNYCNDIRSERGKCGNRLYDELINSKIISDNSNYFKIDYDSPKYDESKAFDKLVSEVMEEEDISEEEATDIVNGWENENDDEYNYAIIRELIYRDIITDDEESFELNYDELIGDEYDYIDEYAEKMVRDLDVDDLFNEITDGNRFLHSSFFELDTLYDEYLEYVGGGKIIGEEYITTISNEDIYIYER